MRTFSQIPKATQQITSAKTTIPARARFWQSREMDSILHLERTIGNQAVQQLLQAKQKNRDANSTDNVVLTGFNYDFSRIPVHTNVYSKLQAKQTVNVPGDKCEQHADAVAEGRRQEHVELADRERVRRVGERGGG